MTRGDNSGFEEALELGLVQRVIEGDFMQQVMEYARGFLPPGKASQAVGLIKRAVQSGLEMSLHNGLALERELQQRLFQSEDAREGLEAYLAKRDPEFRGR